MNGRPPRSTLFPNTPLSRSQYADDPDDYAQRYPQLTSFLNWLDAHLPDVTVKSARHRLKTLTGQDVANHVKSFEFKRDRKSTRLNSSHANISYAVFCLKKKK